MQERTLRYLDQMIRLLVVSDSAVNLNLSIHGWEGTPIVSKLYWDDEIEVLNIATVVIIVDITELLDELSLESSLVSRLNPTGTVGDSVSIVISSATVEVSDDLGKKIAGFTAIVAHVG